jgi:hypothetical protein
MIIKNKGFNVIYFIGIYDNKENVIYFFLKLYTDSFSDTRTSKNTQIPIRITTIDKRPEAQHITILYTYFF